MSFIEKESNNIYNLIKNNDVTAIENFFHQYNIQPHEWHKMFENDLLIYAIEHEASMAIIEYLISFYDTLNYSFYRDNGRYKSPLFSAVAECHFDVAKCLMKHNVDINYDLEVSSDPKITQNILYYLSSYDYINIRNLRFLLHSGFHPEKIKPDIINDFINVKYKNCYLDVIFKYYIFDNEFILHLLQYYKYYTPLSDKQFYTIVATEKNKIKITDEMYRLAMKKWYDKVNVIELLINYDCKKPDQLLDIIQKYEILEKGIRCNNLNLVKKAIYFYEINDMKKINIDYVINEVMSYNHTSIIKYLIDHLHHYSSNNPYEKFLLPASKNNNIEVIEFILNKMFIIRKSSESDKDTNTIINTHIITKDNTDTSYFSLIINLCIKTRNLLLLKYLLKNKNISVDINNSDKNNEFPIIIAYYNTLVHFQKDEHKCVEIFKYLLEHGAMGYIKDVEGNSVFSLSIKEKNYSALKYLLKYNYNFNCITSTLDIANPMVHAIFQNDINTVQELVNDENNNYEKIIVDNIMTTPIILSYLLNRHDIFKFLLKNLNIHEIDQYGNNIFYYALLKEDVHTINYLITLGMNVNFNENSNGRGNTPIHIAIKMDGDLPLMLVIKSSHFRDEDKKYMIHQLIKHGSNINDFNKENKQSALAYAIHEKSLFLIKLLIRYGAKINYVVNNTYQSLLVFALRIGDLDTLSCLIEYTPEDHILDSFIEELVEQYEKGQIIEIFEYLVKYNLNNITKRIIRIIIIHNKYELLKTIIGPKFNVNINLKDKEGNVPLVYAIKNRNKTIIKYLIEHGANVESINHKGDSLNNINEIYNYNYYQNEYSEIKTLLNPLI
ncbi:hypothetical protein PIROE2DRAFT_15940 [Piromyces sp. E2]|nr:hypothetical protein PIROE2DRAFT_15940 [Piromyces sp. E2]|eukprot:OUM58702.1 hypothetical protein PIROE2DRAFT_15940 [Piromyces sp. E2]